MSLLLCSARPPHLLALALSSAVLLSACGSGSDDTNAETVTMPSAQRYMGDWFAYETTTTQTVGGTGVSQTAQTRYVHQVNGDGSSVRVDSYGGGSTSLRATRNYDAQSRQVSNVRTTAICTYAPAVAYAPTPGTAASQAQSINSVETCTPPGGTASLGTDVGTTTVLGAESRTIPLGSFSTVKYQSIYTYTPSGGAGAWRYNETCWVDRSMGRSVECYFDTSYTPTGQTAPTFASTQVFRLVAYSFNGAAAVGPAVRRFAGTWDLSLKRATGSSISACTLTVDLAGLVSGSCPGVGVSASASTPPATLQTLSLTGTVSATGALSLTAPEGLTVSGSLTSPIAGSGNWVSSVYLSESTASAGVNAGSWTGSHR